MFPGGLFYKPFYRPPPSSCSHPAAPSPSNPGTRRAPAQTSQRLPARPLPGERAACASPTPQRPVRGAAYLTQTPAARATVCSWPGSGASEGRRQAPARPRSRAGGAPACPHLQPRGQAHSSAGRVLGLQTPLVAESERQRRISDPPGHSQRRLGWWKDVPRQNTC